MKKTFRMKNLDCANCAAKMENGISKLDGVKSVSINFMLQKMQLDVEDGCIDAVLEEARKICRKIEPDCEVL